MSKYITNLKKSFDRIRGITRYHSPLVLFSLIGVGLLIISASSRNEPPEPFVKHSGELEELFEMAGPFAKKTGSNHELIETAGPPMEPEAWYKLPGDVLGEDDIWGNRANARTIFEFPGGMGLLYSSHPGPELRSIPGWTEEQLKNGLTTGPSGSLAYTFDLFNWHDHPKNPVLNETKRSWQTPARVHTRDMFYDPVNNRWVAYFGNIPGSNDIPGIRTVGVAYSEDLINWEYADGPILTIEDYAAMVPERVEATEEELHEHGRVYLLWGMYFEGRYYFSLSGTETVGRRPDDANEDAGVVRSLSTGRILLVADSPEGPFEHVSEIDEDHIPPGPNKPVYINGKWYTVFTDIWDDQPGFGLAWSDELFGTYTRNPDNPIIIVETIQRSHPLLFHYNGVWGVLFSRGGIFSDSLPLRMAIERSYYESNLPDIVQQPYPVYPHHLEIVPPKPEFIWETIPHATKYQVHIAKGNFANIVTDTTLADPDESLLSLELLLLFELEAGETYRWRIRGMNPFKVGPWSEEVMFRVQRATTAENLAGLPREFELGQNYPNPFNPITMIRYSLPFNAFVTLRVYDMIGRELEILVNGQRPAGHHSVVFDSGEMPSGVYQYVIKAIPEETGSSHQRFLQTRSMTLIK